MIEKVGVYCRLSDEDRDKLNKNDDIILMKDYNIGHDFKYLF